MRARVPVRVRVRVRVSDRLGTGGLVMEAVAQFTFRATENDELSFTKGDVLKVGHQIAHTNCLPREKNSCT